MKQSKTTISVQLSQEDELLLEERTEQLKKQWGLSKVSKSDVLRNALKEVTERKKGEN